MLNPRPKPPMPGGECTFFFDSGPQEVPPGIKTVKLIPVGDGGPGPLLPRVTRPPKKRKPVLPTAAEVAALPRGARVAFAARCAARVAPLVELGEVEDVVGAAALAILRAVSDPWAFQFFRKDFARARRLAKTSGWTDDTPVPLEVFGAMWPEGRAPKWAKNASG